MANPNPNKRRLRDEAAALACRPEKAQVYYRDIEEPSLRLRVTRAGARVWDWRRGDTTKLIGNFPAIQYDEAKAKAVAWSQAVERGRDARAVVLDAEMANTVQDLFDAYVARKIEDNSRKRKPNESKANVLSQTRPLRDRYGDLPLLDLSRDVIMQVVRSHHLSGPRDEWTVSSARQMITWVRSAWNWGQRNKVVSLVDRFGKPLLNPAASLIEDERDLRLPKQKGRRRGYTVDLEDDELMALLQGLYAARAAYKPGRKRRAMDAHAIRNPAGLLIVEFCLMTGCRKSEAIWLYQSDVQGDRANVPDGDAARALRESATLDEHKTEATGEQREIWLSPEAKRVLAMAAEWRRSIHYTGPLVFPGPSGRPCSTVNHSLDTAIQMGGLKRRIVVHSLRGAYINYACRAGVPIEVVSKNVGHSDVETTRKYYREVHRRIQAAGSDAMAAEFARLREKLAA